MEGYERIRSRKFEYSRFTNSPLEFRPVECDGATSTEGADFWGYSKNAKGPVDGAVASEPARSS